MATTTTDRSGDGTTITRLTPTQVLTGMKLPADPTTTTTVGPGPGTGFPDVPSGHAYYTAITHLAGAGVISGFEDKSFRPEASVTRQQFAKMIVLAGTYPVSVSDVCPFTDVAPEMGTDPLYPSKYVAVCAVRGITKGKTPTTFDPYSSITRYQVISMVARAADDLKPGVLVTPPDGWTRGAGLGSDPTHGANALRAEYGGLLSGLDFSTFDPYGNMTRGEVAQILYNLLQM